MLTGICISGIIKMFQGNTSKIKIFARHEARAGRLSVIMLYSESFMYRGYEVTYRENNFGGCAILIRAHLGMNINYYKYHEFYNGTVRVIAKRNGVIKESKTLETLEMPPRVKKIIKYIIAIK